MRKPKGRPDNFKVLDPGLASTRRLVEGMEAMLNPIPWQPEHDGLIRETPPLRELAERIERRADAGYTVHLKPQTAQRVALALHLVADGIPLTDWSVRQDYGHTVQDWTHEPADVLAWCKTGELAIGAWENYAPLRPHREIVVRWGVFTQKRSSRDLK